MATIRLVLEIMLFMWVGSLVVLWEMLLYMWEAISMLVVMSGLVAAYMLKEI